MQIQDKEQKVTITVLLITKELVYSCQDNKLVEEPKEETSIKLSLRYNDIYTNNEIDIDKIAILVKKQNYSLDIWNIVSFWISNESSSDYEPF